MIDNSVSHRINLARYIMICGIVLLHVPPTIIVSEVSTVFEYIKAFFSFGVFRSSVPVLSAVSGYLLFKSLPRKHTTTILKSKVETLLIPMVIWNLPLFVALYFVQMRAADAQSFSFVAYPVTLNNFFNGVFGLNGTPVNYPLSFLRDIFALALISPLLYKLISRFTYAGLLAISIFFWFDLDAAFLLRNEMAINFCCGGAAAILNWDLHKFDKYRFFALTGLMVSCSALIYFDVENRNYFRVVAPFLVWPIFSYLSNTKIESWIVSQSSKSFFIFCAHAPILFVVSASLLKIIPDGELFQFAFWLLCPVAVVIICTFGYNFGKKYTPKLLAISLGKR